MENLTDKFIKQIIDSLGQTPVSPSREQSYLSFLLCKNLSDLCETGRAIINSFESKGQSIDNFPERKNIALCQQILQRYYTDNMFIPDEEVGNKPNWSAIQSFPKDRSDVAFKIYSVIGNNITNKPIGKDIQKAISNRNRKFFIDNFDTIFINLPFKDGLIKFKNFVSSPHTLKENEEYIWEFFDALISIFINENENIQELKNM